MECKYCKANKVVIEGVGWFHIEPNEDGEVPYNIDWEVYGEPGIEPENYYCLECGETWEY